MGFTKFIVFVASIGAAILILKYVEPIVRLVGKNDLAEKYLGMGGTYTMWKIIAIIIPVVALVWWLG